MICWKPGRKTRQQRGSNGSPCSMSPRPTEESLAPRSQEPRKLPKRRSCSAKMEQQIFPLGFVWESGTPLILIGWMNVGKFYAINHPWLGMVTIPPIKLVIWGMVYFCFFPHCGAFKRPNSKVYYLAKLVGKTYLEISHCGLRLTTQLQCWWFMMEIDVELDWWKYTNFFVDWETLQYT